MCTYLFVDLERFTYSLFLGEGTKTFPGNTRMCLEVNMLLVFFMGSMPVPSPLFIEPFPWEAVSLFLLKSNSNMVPSTST